ncbi:pyridoxine/pyridoxamine 5'-phosphate oxidase [Goodfellowiella coeruleoviolacea]|uniref:Pyridoxamine 5'-phosphate oxidase n=1 Tax=Goodfellowiella coeruleoviolacea TaxID=334858 RepID=A0AAE3GKP6_9PSEU|nr:pyridoxal 5'-phosphate synthase [Goodfellowiella coeruleoviolacea]MCP2167818.1 Pyridoxamine 5'-phosphate oxidase [Goodfellowiella coeruleoviolacea]
MSGPRTEVVDGLATLLRGLEVFGGPLPTFDPGTAPDHPVPLFTEWLTLAIRSGLREPHATTLSTVDGQGRPSARVLILKDVDDTGWHFAFSAASRKGAELAARPWAALTFYWSELARQVRLRGPVRSAAPEVSARDFRERPPASRAGALLARQSQPMADPADLDRALAQAHQRIADDPGVVAPEWTRYRVVPDEVEFWQGDKQRRHTRLRYLRTGEHTWDKELLWP